MQEEQQEETRKQRSSIPAKRVLKQCVIILGAFYAGYYQGATSSRGGESRSLRSYYDYDKAHQHEPSSDDEETAAEATITAKPRLYTKEDLDDRIEQRMKLFTKLQEKTQQRVQNRERAAELISATTTTASSPGKRRRGGRRRRRLLPTETKSFASAISVVDRNQFAKLLDTGIPLEPSTRTNAKVMLLHSSEAIPPKDAHNAGAAAAEDDDSSSHVSYISNVEDAIQNCNHLSVVYTSSNRPDQCVAIMGQFNSYHVHRFMRTASNKPNYIENEGNKNKRVVNTTQPLRQVSRGADTRYEFTTKTPTLKQTKQYWNTTLRPYLTNLDTYLEEFKPILKRIALCKTVVVMVCNYGHVDLLRNFVCNAQAKGLEHHLSGLLVFATDLQTAKIAKDELGLETYYNEQLFQRIPQQKAKGFGDSTYGATIVSKVYCVQLVNMLGYHVLFNDVDLVWYRDPLEFFQSNKTSTEIDIYMSHDGNHEEFYAPYSGNTGFYYIRNTPRTQYFLNSLLVSGDLIAATKTHQAPFLQVLNEHVSLHGLRVKILDDDIFPGGLQFQHHRRYMKRFLLLTKAGDDGKTMTTSTPAEAAALPYMLHMSWTKNLDQKIQFFQQLGEFYVNDYCILNTQKYTSNDTTSIDEEPKQCCSAVPIIKCHYRDRPSRIPCRDSPKFANGKSFW